MSKSSALLFFFSALSGETNSDAMQLSMAGIHYVLYANLIVSLVLVKVFTTAREAESLNLHIFTDSQVAHSVQYEKLSIKGRHTQRGTDRWVVYCSQSEF